MADRLYRLTLASFLTGLLGLLGTTLITHAPRVGLTLTTATTVLGGLTIITWWTTR
jgi:hypothetical protein